MKLFLLAEVAAIGSAIAAAAWTCAKQVSSNDNDIEAIKRQTDLPHTFAISIVSGVLVSAIFYLLPLMSQPRTDSAPTTTSSSDTHPCGEVDGICPP